MLRILAFVFLLSSLSGPAAAEPSRLTTLDNANAARAWRAVGRVDMGRQGFCSGSLVAPDLVLTAAHCLYENGTENMWPVESLVFHAGLRNGRAAVSRKIVAMVAHPGFRPNTGMSQENIENDVALLRLSTPISTFDIAPFQVLDDDPRLGPVSIVSYGRGREDAQSRQRECNLLERDDDVLIFDCDVTFGSSGAPIFTYLNGRNQIMSVISGMTTHKGQKVSIGMDLTEKVNLLKRALRIGFVSPTAKAKHVSAGDRSSGSSAKFVRAGKSP